MNSSDKIKGCHPNYMRGMKKDFAKGMGIAISSWGHKWASLAYLDAETECKDDCTNKPFLYISNIQI